MSYGRSTCSFLFAPFCLWPPWKPNGCSYHHSVSKAATGLRNDPFSSVPNRSRDPKGTEESGSQTAAVRQAERVPIPSFGQTHRRCLCLCRIMSTTYDAIQKKGVCPCRHRRRREPATLSAPRCAPGKRCSRLLLACSSRLALSPSRRPRSSRLTCLSTVSASRPTSFARRCSACLAAPTWSASLPRAPIPSLSPSSAWPFVPRARPVWCAPSWRTT